MVWKHVRYHWIHSNTTRAIQTGKIMEGEGVVNMEQTIEEEYRDQLYRLKKVISILNPLQGIMGEEAVGDLICDPNVEL